MGISDEERVRIINSPEYREAECFLFPLMLDRAKAETVGDNVDVTIKCMEMLRAVRDETVEAEREACAELANTHRVAIYALDPVHSEIALAIRARSETDDA